jgi:hypothetical protein
MSIPTIKTFSTKNDSGLIVEWADYDLRIVSIEIADQYNGVTVLVAK